MTDDRMFQFSGQPERLDRFLSARLAPLSRTRVQRLIDEGAVKVNGLLSPSRRLLSPGDRVAVQIPEFSSLPPSSAEDVPILFEDDSLIVVNKPAGWVVHPAGPHREGTLIQRLWPKLSKAWSAHKGKGTWSADRPGVVHRLDRGTSGVIVIAKTPAAAENLSRQFADRTVRKTYRAVVWGVPLHQKGRVRSVVGRSRRQPHRMSVTDQGRWSETEFTVIEKFPKTPFPSPFKKGGAGMALLEVRPLTGRTHQIRVQLAALDHPIVGDRVYGPPAPLPLDRPLLHALRLEFIHPVTRRRMAWRAEPPADFSGFLKALTQ